MHGSLLESLNFDISTPTLCRIPLGTVALVIVISNQTSCFHQWRFAFVIIEAKKWMSKLRSSAEQRTVKCHVLGHSASGHQLAAVLFVK